MITPEDILTLWEDDSIIADDMSHEVIRIPKLHNKYYRNLIKVKQKLFEINDIFETKKHLKVLYYSGRGSTDEYRENPFDHKLTKGEIPMWIAADSDLKNLRVEIGQLEILKEILDEIMKQINNRNWLIKAYLESETIKLGIRG